MQNGTLRQEAQSFLQAIEEHMRQAKPLAALERGDRSTATRSWAALLKKDPSDYRTAHHLAILHHSWALELEESGRHKQAARHWREGLEAWHRVWKADRFWQALVEKGKSLGRDFRPKTVEQFRKDLPGRLLRINAAYVGYWLEAGQTERARQHLKYILDSPFPEEIRQTVREEIAQPFLDEAERLADRGDFDRAVQQLETLLSVDPDHAKGRQQAADTYNLRGVKLHSERKIPEARRSFERALELVPDHEEARRNLEGLTLEMLISLFRR